jgi:beta-aspartyl-dipeptidase (metallo-type)
VLSGLTVGSCSSLWEAVKESILIKGVPLEVAARTVTANPARALKLAGKGKLAVGADADVLLLDSASLAISGLVAGGRTVVRDGKVLVQAGS